MEGDVLKYGWLIVLTLAQIVYIGLKVMERRNGKKKEIKPDNPGYGERIASLETGMENMKDNNEKDHRLLRNDIQKLFGFFNAVKK